MVSCLYVSICELITLFPFPVFLYIELLSYKFKGRSNEDES